MISVSNDGSKLIEPRTKLWKVLKIIFIIFNVIQLLALVTVLVIKIEVTSSSNKCSNNSTVDFTYSSSLFCFKFNRINGMKGFTFKEIIISITIGIIVVIIALIGIVKLHLDYLYLYTIITIACTIHKFFVTAVMDHFDFYLFIDIPLITIMFLLIREIKLANRVTSPPVSSP